MNYRNFKVFIAIIMSLIITFSVTMTGCSHKKEEEQLQYDDPVDTMFYQPINDDNDYDNDKLTNEQELNIGTNQYIADTDEDGLGDYYEITYSKTNPLKMDTDGDTLSDLVELKAKLDPLNKCSDGKTQDDKRIFNETYKNNNITVKFQGDANLYNTYCAPFELPGLSKTPGVMSEAIEIYHNDAMPSATITFKYKESQINALGGSVENLGIFTFTESGTFKAVKDITHDEDKQSVSCEIKKSGKYMLCDSVNINVKHKNQVMLLIDNSGSMFPKDMVSTSDENDVDFKRLDMAKSIIKNISDNTHYGIAKFTATYTQMCYLGAPQDKLFETIDSIRDIDEDFNGTYIASSIIKALDNFNENHSQDRKFIIILTDGETTERGSATQAIKKCNEANVSVITIALGKSVDAEYLYEIAEKTDGAYIYANNADALQDVYNSVFASLMYSAEDLDNDGKLDSYVVADSGFNMDRDAFSFENMATIVPQSSIQQHGFCYGMAMLAQAYYRDIDIYSGSEYTTKLGLNQYKVDDYNIREIVKNVENLKDLYCVIARKWTNIHNIPTKDRCEVVDGVLKYKKEILEKYQDEYFTIKTINKRGKFGESSYKKAETIYIDIEKYISQDETRDDMEIMKALYWLWASQMSDKVKLDKYSLQNNIMDTATESEFDAVVTAIRSGIPLIVTFKMPEGGHAINAMRILRDTENPNDYYLICYDNNDGIFPRTFKIVQSEKDWWTGASASNWDENFCYRTYQFIDGEWKDASLDLFALVP